MALMDEFKEERETIKNASFQKRLEYFWEYYKWWVIGGVFIIIAASMTIHSIATRKKEVLYVAMINAVEVAGSDVNSNIKEPFLLNHELDPKKNNINLDSDVKMNFTSIAHTKANPVPEGYEEHVSTYNSANARQTLSVYIAAAQVDMIVSTENWFDEYAYGSFYLPLSEVLTPEEMEKYSDYFYYIDDAVRKRYKKATDERDYNLTEMYPDPYDLESMEEPVAYGLIAGDNSQLIACYGFIPEYKEDNIVIGVMANGTNPELTHDLLIQLIDDVAGQTSNAESNSASE